MPKFRNNRYGVSMNLQLFAEGGDTGADAGDGDDQDDTEGGADEGGEDEPKYTQADIDSGRNPSWIVLVFLCLKCGDSKKGSSVCCRAGKEI